MNMQSRRRSLLPRLAAAFLGLALVAGAAPRDDAREDDEGAEEPQIPLRFEGWLPGTIDPDLEGTFDVEFRLYLSPQGGEAVWSETRSVAVSKGRMDVQLGTVEPIPMRVHEATFKFLGASVEGAREVYPRYAVVNVVYVSPKEALVAVADGEPGEDADPDERDAYAARPGWTVADETRTAATWREALDAAREAGGDLPDYADWYASLATCTRDAALERAGHYEWVQPWVYDTASHGRFNRYFRGRFQGCDYMDLSPENRYAWRVASRPDEAAAEGADG